MRADPTFAMTALSPMAGRATQALIGFKFLFDVSLFGCLDPRESGMRVYQLMALACISVLATFAQSETIRFAPIPMVDEQTLRAEYLPMLGYLGKKTGDVYEWVYLPKYPDLIQAMIDGHVDLAVLGSLPYVMLTRRAADFEPLARFREKDGRADYDCALVAFGADHVLKPRDIRGKRIGLTQPASTCGYLAVSRLLKKVGLAIDKGGNRFEYAGNHTKAALGVVQGRYDVAGLKRSEADKYADLGLRVIAETGPYPALTLVANTRRLSKERRALIRAVLLDADARARAAWGEGLRAGAAPAKDSDYTVTRRQLTELGTIPESGER
jgi:phosphonate transport system substrate-binding protein